MKKLSFAFIAFSLSTAFAADPTFVELRIDKDKLKTATTQQIRDLYTAAIDLTLLQPSDANMAAAKSIVTEILDRASAVADKAAADKAAADATYKK